MTIGAIVIALALYLAATLPLAWFSRRGELRGIALVGGGILIAAFASTGLVSGGADLPKLSRVSEQQLRDKRCEDVLRILQENRIILDKPSSAQIVVSKTMWANLPEMVRGATIACVKGDSDTDVAIVER